MGFLLYKRNVFGYFSYNIIDTNELLTFKSTTMYQELIKIGQKNIQHLKYCMNICEAQLWGGPRHIKQKYLKQLGRLKMKMKEEQTYIKLYKGQLLMSLLQGMVDSKVIKPETNTNFRHELYSFTK